MRRTRRCAFTWLRGDENATALLKDSGRPGAVQVESTAALREGRKGTGSGKGLGSRSGLPRSRNALQVTVRLIDSAS